jgi:Fur family ferric uptake transcriptional regulator/Fur family peroxide stress response transcriptional regulator
MINPDSPELFKRLREHGLRPTKARRLVLALLDKKNDHLNPEGILKVLRDKGHPISVATLYQNLNNLVEAGILIRIKGPDGSMRLDTNLTPHHHLICETCGKMVDVTINRETQLPNYPNDFHTNNPLSDWRIDHIKIEFNGTCPKCQI